MPKMIGSPKVTHEAIKEMQESPYSYPTTRWAVYQNHDIGHPELGELQFIAIGPLNTIKEPTRQMPDTQYSLGWRYMHVGFIDLDTGDISEE